MDTLLLLWLTHNAAFVLLWAKKENNWIAHFSKKTTTLFSVFLFPHYCLASFSKRSPWKRLHGSFASAICHVWPEACVRDDVDQPCDRERDFEKHSALLEPFDEGCVVVTTSDSKGFRWILAHNAAVTWQPPWQVAVLPWLPSSSHCVKVLGPVCGWESSFWVPPEVS